MPRYKICTSADIAIPSAINGLATIHAYAGPPAPAPLAPCLEAPTPMFWPPGMATAQNKLTTRVLHRGRSIVQDGHDVGCLVPHVSIPPTNALTPVQMLFSKRAAVFFDPNVRFERRYATACSFYAWPPAPMQTCFDPIALPLGTAVGEQWNTVEFSMSWNAYLASAAICAATMVVDLVFKRGRLLSAPASASLRNSVRSGVEKLVGGRNVVEAFTKAGINAAIGVGKFAAVDGTRKTSISVPGSPFIRADVATTPSGEVVVGGRIHGVGREIGTEGRDVWSFSPSEVLCRDLTPSRWGAPS